MYQPRDRDVPAGVRHRALADLEMRLHERDGLSAQVRLLPAGSIFQPWTPREHWRGVQVPITLGGEDESLTSGGTSPTGHFLAWDDFFDHCGPAAEHRDWYRPAGAPSALPRPADELFHRDALGRTPLFAAAALGRRGEVEAMLALLPGTGCYPQRLGLLEVRDHQGLTAADLAERCGENELADLLRYKAWAMETFG